MWHRQRDAQRLWRAIAMPGGDSIALLRRLIESGPGDDPVRQWMFSALTRWLRSDRNLSVPACMGLPNKPALARRALRNVYLCAAASRMEGSVWARAQLLRKAINRFACATWPRWRHLSTPPSRATELESLLFRAFSTGAPMPDTVQAFCNVLVGIAPAAGPSENSGRLGFESSTMSATEDICT